MGATVVLAILTLGGATVDAAGPARGATHASATLMARGATHASVTGAAADDGFAFSARRVSGAVRERVVGSSWRPGCPVPLRQLRYVRVAFRDFDGDRRVGELIVHADAVATMRSAFARLYAEEFPIRRMRLVDDYGASDFRSIEADNTSAFNCRAVTGGTAWSQHSYGRAIDVNPIENPYVAADGTTSHRRSRPFLDRSDVRPGMATRRGVLVRAFRARGWGWGGSWSSPKDYQHFSANGR